MVNDDKVPSPARVRLLGRLVLLALLTLGVTGGVTGGVPAPARADVVSICTGYSGCQQAGYPHAGYAGAAGTMYWRMYTGHNCTNYAAYRMVKAGLSNTRPWSGSGNAENWGHAMASITDRTPMVGAVAWWDENVRPAGSSGHVAYVERVVSASEIWVSEDSWGGDFHWRKITKSGTGWPSGFIQFKDRALRSRVAPEVSGTPQVGRTLSVIPGTWAPAATSYAYQWLADGVPVDGAVGPSFLLGPGKVGRRITVQVSASASGYVAAAATSAPTAAVAPGELSSAERPVVTGEPLVGSVLTVSEGTWSPTVRSHTVQWLADGEPIAGQRDWALELGPEQAGTTVSAVVTATRRGYEPSSVSSAATGPVLGGEVTLTAPFELSGTPRLGEQLSVGGGSFDPPTATATYTWLRDGTAIAGAGGPTYVLGADDVGRHLSVRVDVAKPGYRPASQTTAETAGVRSVPRLDVEAVAGVLRARVAVAVTAPGVAAPVGEVKVRVGLRTRTVTLSEGAATVLLRRVPAGTRRVVVRYLGGDLVDPGVFRGTVRVPAR